MPLFGEMRILLDTTEKWETTDEDGSTRTAIVEFDAENAIVPVSKSLLDELLTSAGFRKVED